jgi:outer membrane protein assembly factor BamB
MKKLHVFLLPCCLLALALPALAVDWRQWRGPDRTDVSQETGLLKSWPKDGPKLLWTYEDAGTGYSGPAVVGDRLYAMGATDTKEYVFVLDVNTGKKVWQTEFAARFRNGYGDGPRGTPTTDGDRLYVIGGQGELACLETAGGKIVWQKNLRTDLGGSKQGNWGYTESPLIDGDKVVCTPGGPKGAVAALDKKTGEVLWRSKGYTDAAAYSSPVIGNGGGIRQYVQMTGDGLAGVAADDGRLLWYFRRPSRTAAVPTPIVFDNFVYASSGYGCGAHLLKLSPDGDKLRAEEVFASRDMTNHHGGVIKVGDYFYGHSDSGGWTCQDAKTGKAVWTSRKLDKGSVTCADGHLYCYGEGRGVVVLIEVSPEGWKEKGRFTIPKQTTVPRQRGRIWTHPVVANGRLYLRDQDLLFCYDVKESSAAQ